MFRSFDTSPVKGLSSPGRLCCAVRIAPISTYLCIRDGQSGPHPVSFNRIRFRCPRRYDLFLRNVRGGTRIQPDTSRSRITDVRQCTRSWLERPPGYEIEDVFRCESLKISQSKPARPRTLADIVRRAIFQESSTLLSELDIKSVRTQLVMRPHLDGQTSMSVMVRVSVETLLAAHLNASLDSVGHRDRSLSFALIAFST